MFGCCVIGYWWGGCVGVFGYLMWKGGWGRGGVMYWFVNVVVLFNGKRLIIWGMDR